MRLKSQLLSPSIIYLRVWCEGLYSPLIRMSRGASNFYDSGVSSQEVWGLMIFVPPSPGLFLLLLMFRNCEGSPRVPACCCLCHPGRWAEEKQPPSLERFWISSEMTGMRFYLISSTQHWLLSVSWVLADQRGKFAIFYPSQHSTDK